MTTDHGPARVMRWGLLDDVRVGAGVGDNEDSAVVRIVEQYDSLVELELALLMRDAVGWFLLSAGEVRPGRWWAEYESLTGLGLT